MHDLYLHMYTALVSHVAQKFLSRLSKQGAHLMTEIQRLMFSSDGYPIAITENRETFMDLMYAFHCYEKNVSDELLLGAGILLSFCFVDQGREF